MDGGRRCDGKRDLVRAEVEFRTTPRLISALIEVVG